MTIRISIVATHPIQYQVPWFQALAREHGISLKVYFALLPDPSQQGAGFGIPFKWDIPMLDGYDWVALENKSSNASLTGFFSSSTPAIRHVLSEDRPDMAIVTGWNSLPLIQALAACIALGIPRMVRGESNAMRRRRVPVRLAHRALLSRFDAFLSIGKSNREFYLANGVQPKRIFDCRYFVDNDRFRAGSEKSRPQRSTLRERWGVPESAFCFLYVGKLEPKKRILDLLCAIRIAAMTRKDIHLLVVGTGDLFGEAQSTSTSLGLPVSLAGFLNQSELPQAYAAADCLVLPSDFGETWGLVVNEAMACGLPALVSDRVGCGPDLVEPGETGSVFPFGDVSSLATALIRLSSDREVAHAMGVRAQRRVSDYSVQAAVAGTVMAAEFVQSGSS